jgi:hypothetical protein
MSNRMVAVWVADAGFPGLRDPERGKSELRRAVCRITSGRVVSKPLYGKCHRKYTALGRGERTVRAVLLEPDARAKQAQAVRSPRVEALGKGEKVR